MRVRGYAEGVPCWAELGTPDPAGAARFYADVLGWACDGTAFRLDGLAVAGVGHGPAGWLTYVAAGDLGPLLDLAMDSGGEVVRAPGEVPGRARSALVSDCTGALFGMWQGTGLAGAQLASQPGTVCYSELVTAYPEAAAAFYGKVYGWYTQPGELASGRAYQDWLLGDRMVAGLVEAFADEPAHWRTTVEVADLDAVRERCLDGSGRVELEPIEVSVGRYARLADPYGAVFGVIELIPELRGLR